MPERQRNQVENLVRYCRELDGTELTVFPITSESDDIFKKDNPHNTFARIQAHTLHLEALHFKDRPFLHLEPDSIPTRPGWLKAITEEYHRLGKPFMLSMDSHPPGDVVGGIGVYSPDTHFLIPVAYEKDGWDLWMLKHLSSLISTTPLIQHKYGWYDGMEKTRDVVFPRDKDLLRPETVIFHRDAGQSLMRSQDAPRFLHSGCLGDAIAALPTIRQLGGGHLIVTQKGNPRLLRGPRYEALKPLLEIQPYLRSVTWEEDAPFCDYDFTDFRRIHAPKVSIAETHARYMSVQNLDM